MKLRGLYYITHIDNLESILENGILSHNEVLRRNLKHKKIYSEEIIKKRQEKRIENKPLGEFANLYFQPRNAMLYRIIFLEKVDVNQLVIIGVKPDILNRKDIYISDGNAASDFTNFYSSNDKDYKKILKKLRNEVNKDWWSDFDGSKRRLMAECLIEKYVPLKYILELYVATHKARENVEKIIKNRKISVVLEPKLFFLPNREIRLTNNLIIVEGDMFFSRMQTLTISVNTVGVMGKGLASRAKYQFPDVYVKYQELCKLKKLDLGKPFLYKRELSLDEVLSDEPKTLTENNSHTWFLLFPTKRHWKEKASLEGIEEGLKWILRNYKKEGVESLAVPALGCGLGGLEWRDVGPLMVRYLKKLEIPVRIYLPLEKKIPDEQLTKNFLLN